MATVRLSRELRDDIIRAVEAPFYARVKQAHEDAEKHWPDSADLRKIALKKMFGDDNLALLEKIPASWLPASKSVFFGMVNGVKTNRAAVNFDTPVPIPYSIKERTYGAPTIDIHDPVFDAYASAVIAREERLTAITQERVSVSNTVRKLLDQCNTLKQALDAYPALAKWVPQSALDQHAAPSDRKSQVRAVREKVDLSVITSALMRQRVEG